MIKHVIIRLDTILDSFPYNLEEIFALIGSKVKLKVDISQFKDLDRMSQFLHEKLSQNDLEVVCRILKEYDLSNVVGQARLYVDIKERLISLSKRGLNIYATSFLSKEAVEKILSKEGLSHVFKAIYARESGFTEHERVRSLIRGQGLKLEEAVYIGYPEPIKNINILALKPDEFIKENLMEEEFY
ncbi:MAG: hypothetical protein DRJ41_03090 [Thermoprotei archaeon]|nr:MAG: hypothetical protein DRJ41_03090 [Thermoprotei archaeon]